jgi:hypothetical protein
MASPALVEREIELGHRITRALLGVPVGLSLRAALWLFSSDWAEWRFVVAADLVELEGTRATYERLRRTLDGQGLLADLELRRLVVRRPSDPVVRALAAAIEVGRDGRAVRVVANMVGGVYIEDAYVFFLDRPERRHSVRGGVLRLGARGSRG